MIVRLIVGWETSNDSASSTWTRFLRRYVNVTTIDLYRPRIGGQTSVGEVWLSFHTMAHRSVIWSFVKPVV